MKIGVMNPEKSIAGQIVEFIRTEGLAPGAHLPAQMLADRLRVSRQPVNTALAALAQQGVPHAAGGTYVAMEGPQFSTLAESQLYRSWGAQVIGMTNMPEAKLAREAEISYCTIAMVTDYDCWHEDHGSVDVAKVIEVLKANSGNATRLVSRIARDYPRQHPPCPAGSDRALDFAIMTAPDKRDPQLLARLDAVAGRVLKA